MSSRTKKRRINVNKKAEREIIRAQKNYSLLIPRASMYNIVKKNCNLKRINMKMFQTNHTPL